MDTEISDVLALLEELAEAMRGGHSISVQVADYGHSDKRATVRCEAIDFVAVIEYEDAPEWWKFVEICDILSRVRLYKDNPDA